MPPFRGSKGREIDDPHHGCQSPTSSLTARLPLDAGVRVVDEDLEEVDHDHRDEGRIGLNAKKSRRRPIRGPSRTRGDLDPAERGPETPLSTPDDLLVGMVGVDDIEGETSGA